MHETLLWIQEGWNRASPALVDAARRLDSGAHAWVTRRLADGTLLHRRSAGLALAALAGLWLWGVAGSAEDRTLADLQDVTDSPAVEWERHDVWIGLPRAEEWQPGRVWNTDLPRRRPRTPDAAPRRASPEPRSGAGSLLARPVPSRRRATPPGDPAPVAMPGFRLPWPDPALDDFGSLALAPSGVEPVDPNRSESGGAPPSAGGGAVREPSTSAGPALVSQETPTEERVAAEPITGIPIAGAGRRPLEDSALGPPHGEPREVGPFRAPPELRSEPTPAKREPALDSLPPVAAAAGGREESPQVENPAVAADHRDMAELGSAFVGSPPGLAIAKGAARGGSGSTGGPLGSSDVVAPGHSPGAIDELGDLLLSETDVFDVASLGSPDILPEVPSFDSPVPETAGFSPASFSGELEPVGGFPMLSGWNMTIGAVPEPSTALLFALGLVGLALRR